MNMVIPNSGKLKLNYWMLKSDGSDLTDFELRLYSNNFTPVDGSTTVDFTEATFPGYAPLTIDRADFDGPAIIDDVAYVTALPTPEWTCSGGGGQLIYGWYLVTLDDDTLIAAQKFDTPRNMTSGATEKLDPYSIGLKTLD